MAYGDVAAVPSAARTTTGNSGALAVEKGTTLNVMPEVTASSGTTPTLDLSVEWSMDGVNFTAATPADSFTQITTSPSRAIKQFQIKAPFCRIVWTIAGTTPSFTFSVSRYVTSA